jgi:hypothetical protein
MTVGDSARRNVDRASDTPRRWRRGSRLVTVLDLLVVVLPVWVAGVVLAGRFDRAWVADHHVAEPLLALVLLVPLRVAILAGLARCPPRGRPWSSGFAARGVAGASGITGSPTWCSCSA